MGITKNHIHTANQIALARLFKALAHPARIAIIENLLLHEDLNCNSLRNHIQLAQSTISAHIKELFEVGILGVKVVGSNAYYQLNEISLKQITDYAKEIIKKIDTLVRDTAFVYSKPARKIPLPNFVNTT